MTTEDFVRGFKQQKDQLLRTYLHDKLATPVGALRDSMRLNAEQSRLMEKLFDLVLTDAYYSVLLAFDGCARLGDLKQQASKLLRKMVRSFLEVTASLRE